jgi:hypothetical protein
MTDALEKVQRLRAAGHQIALDLNLRYTREYFKKEDDAFALALGYLEAGWFAFSFYRGVVGGRPMEQAAEEFTELARRTVNTLKDISEGAKADMLAKLRQPLADEPVADDKKPDGEQHGADDRAGKE